MNIEIKKIETKETRLKNKIRGAFDKFETETRASLQGLKAEYESVYHKAKEAISKAELEINAYFESDEFLKVDMETAQYDAEVRAELKHYVQYSPVDGDDVIRISAIKWNAKKAAAALRQDSDKHLATTPVAKSDLRCLQRRVLLNTTDENRKRIENLDELEGRLSEAELRLGEFNDCNNFYAIIF